MQMYRKVLSLPGFRTLLVLIFFARIPTGAAGMVLTLHVAVSMGRGYGAAGTVGAVTTIGIALGAPVLGRVVDRYGLRLMIAITTVGETAFWLSARYLPYALLLVCGFVGGLLVLPAMSIGRQAVAALVPEDLRRTAYSVDSVSTELSFMIGPAAAVFVVTQFSSQAAMVGMACGIVLVGAALFVVNPAVRAESEKSSSPVPRRVWLTPRLVGVLIVGAGTVFILAGTEVAIVAQLRSVGELTWTGLVVVVWSAGSAVGGLVYGALARSYRQVVLMAWLGLLTIPIGLVGGTWWSLMLVLVPAAFLCAPTITATAEEVARLAPPAARGEATGLQSSAFTLGAAAGAPLVGFVVDHASPGWGFAVAGIGGVAVAGVAALLAARDARRREPVGAVS
jgi:MFS family permease